MRPFGPGSYQVTLAWMVLGHLELKSTDHFEGTKPVQFRVKPEPWRPMIYYRSAILYWLLRLQVNMRRYTTVWIFVPLSIPPK